MLSDAHYEALRLWLIRRALLYPQKIDFDFGATFEPQHLSCYNTARAVHARTGWPVVAGIAFLDRRGMLLPWPHMINLKGDNLNGDLVDASPPRHFPSLGFIPILLNETVAWNEITRVYSGLEANDQLVSWGDQNADALTQEFLAVLRRKAECFNWQLDQFEIPESMASHQA